mmetsp:Transcript_47523/g.107731  ORF Transcript_47523/g.107731 Transcript_47523/m.107731 type:complete len:261 (-) Transcript_47523:617-1399(-)
MRLPRRARPQDGAAAARVARPAPRAVRPRPPAALLLLRPEPHHRDGHQAARAVQGGAHPGQGHDLQGLGSGRVPNAGHRQGPDGGASFDARGAEPYEAAGATRQGPAAGRGRRHGRGPGRGRFGRLGGRCDVADDRLTRVGEPAVPGLVRAEHAERLAQGRLRPPGLRRGRGCRGRRRGRGPAVAREPPPLRRAGRPDGADRARGRRRELAQRGDGARDAGARSACPHRRAAAGARRSPEARGRGRDEHGGWRRGGRMRR